jgi:hypothetical protein
MALSSLELELMLLLCCYSWYLHQDAEAVWLELFQLLAVFESASCGFS